MNYKDELIYKLKSYKPILNKKYKITKIGIFGSVARGESGVESDIDIVIQVDVLKPFILLEIKDELEKLIGRKVDLVRFRKNMNEDLKKRIEKEVIYV
ncbi:MAG: nucleotidyltransferase [Persephonella sp.]|nr:MAG: nucleotidyltransferase [Persephonella sp.]RUM61104.1 MAG: nucleotidyltransferase [Persephonella sp.]